jgi:hypothetical protein
MFPKFSMNSSLIPVRMSSVCWFQKKVATLKISAIMPVIPPAMLPMLPALLQSNPRAVEVRGSGLSPVIAGGRLGTKVGLAGGVFVLADCLFRLRLLTSRA